MADKVKKLKVGVINIVLHPHSPDHYINLFVSARELKVTGRINVNKRARIGTLELLKSPQGGRLLGGHLLFYTDLNPNEPWLDDDTGQAADEKQLAELKKQIGKLHPEFRTTRFLFDPSRHRFYFQVKNEEGANFAPATVEKALASIFEYKDLVEVFGECEVTVVPEKDALTKILSIHSLRKLFIDIKSPPNADDQADAFAEVESRMEDMGARRMEITLTKAAGVASLTPDDRIKLLANVAVSNGKVVGIGYDAAGAKVEVSTRQHPQILNYDHLPKASALQSFRDFVFSMLRK